MSSIDRNRRFVVAQTVKKFNAKTWDVAILGEGCDWSDAFGRACDSDLGRAAEADNKKAIELTKQALASATPMEFADRVMHDSLEEAKAAGATDEQLALMKSRFDLARKAIEDGHKDQSPDGKDE